MAALRMLSLASSLLWKPSIPTRPSSSSCHKKISKFIKAKISVTDPDPNPDPFVFGFLDPAPYPLVRSMDLYQYPSNIKGTQA
jgi:hypothetical protein